MFKKRKNKKILSLLGTLSMFFLQILPINIQAATVTPVVNSDGSVNSDTLSGALATATNKRKGPTVTLSFAADSAFKDGSSVTSSAIIDGFLDNTDKLYFTWYLKHDGCDLTNDWWKDDVKESDNSKLKNCDKDGDDLITPNDWKITASRIIVKGFFDKNTANYLSSAGLVSDGTRAEPSVTNSSDGWIRNFKRDSGGKLAQENDKGAQDCYVQQPSSGLIYELRNSEPIFLACPSGYHPACIKDTVAACDVHNPDHTQANVDARQAEIDEAVEWNSDPLNANDPSYPHLVPEQIPQTISSNFDACAVNKEATNSTAGDVFGCQIENETDLNNYEAVLACNDLSETPLCTTDAADMEMNNVQGSLFLGSIFKKDKMGSENDTNGVCSALAELNTDPDIYDLSPNFLNTTRVVTGFTDTEKCSFLSDGFINGIKKDTTILGFNVPNGTTVVNSNTSLSPACTFEKKENLCKHLFPYFPKKTINVNGSDVDLSNDSTGDGEFSLKEKEFWGADPKKASTNETGKNDEANVMGVGIDKMTWTYAAGDEIGVAVEGKSTLTTDHNDSSYRTMWAFSKGACSALKEIENSTSVTNEKRAFYTEDNGTIGILTTDFDLDRCLDENLVAPDDDGASAIKMDLATTPDSPINDPNGTDGDQVTVVASVQNADLSGMYYTWKIEKSSEGTLVPNENTTWTDITSDMITKYGSLAYADKQGVGKSSLNFFLNLPAALVDPSGTGLFYLRVRVAAKETSGAGSQTASGLIIIKVREQENSINTYSVIATDSGNLGLGGNGGSTGLICNDAAGKSTCYVTKNQIVGLRIPNGDGDLSGFAWKVNGVSLTCTSDMSSVYCNGSDNSVLFFPILGNIGEAVDVVASALSKKTGATVEISRHFIIVEPQVQITSLDSGSVWPKLLGFYKDLNGNRYPDYSTQVFETNPGKTMTLGAAVYSAWSWGQGFSWSVDGEVQGNSSDQSSDKLTIVVDKNSGDSYNVGLISNMTHTPEQDKQANNLRKALLKNWGVSPEDAIEESSSANIQINVVEDSSQAMSSANKTGIFASLITNLPEQFMFLIKITLTALMLIFSAGLLFAFMPEALFEKEKNNYPNIYG